MKRDISLNSIYKNRSNDSLGTNTKFHTILNSSYCFVNFRIENFRCNLRMWFCVNWAIYQSVNYTWALICICVFDNSSFHEVESSYQKADRLVLANYSFVSRQLKAFKFIRSVRYGCVYGTRKLHLVNHRSKPIFFVHFFHLSTSGTKFNYLESIEKACGSTETQSIFCCRIKQSFQQRHTIT